MPQAAVPVVLPSDVRRAIVAHARAEAPRECCGLLVGRGATVMAVCRTPNVASGTRRYRVDPGAHFALQRVLRSIRPPLEVLGAYHSHPRGPAEPSATDIEQSPGSSWLHVIVGLSGARPRLAAFRVLSGGIQRVPLTRTRRSRRR